MSVVRRVTNVDAKRGPKKAVWFEDTASEAEDIYPNADGTPRPSRYGPNREYVANCTSIEAADFMVEAWNNAVNDLLALREALDWGRL